VRQYLRISCGNGYIAFAVFEFALRWPNNMLIFNKMILLQLFL
jgi:hypothetical protein